MIITTPSLRISVSLPCCAWASPRVIQVTLTNVSTPTGPFVANCGTTLEKATADLTPDDAIVDETKSLLHSNLNLVSLVTFGRPLEEVQETVDRTVQLADYIVPSRQQRKKNKKRQ